MYIKRKKLHRFDLKAKKISHYSLKTEEGVHGNVLCLFVQHSSAPRNISKSRLSVKGAIYY